MLAWFGGLQLTEHRLMVSIFPESFSRLLSPRWRDSLILAALYVVTAKIGQSLAIEPGNVTPVWLPSGIILAAVLVRGVRVWPGIFLGAFIGNVSSYVDFGSVAEVARAIAAGVANGTGDVLCALVGAWLIGASTKTRYPFRAARHVVAFVVLGAGIGSLISALFGVTGLWLAGFVAGDQYFNVFQTWWTGDGVGVLLLTPLILSWVEIRSPLRRRLEAFLYAVVLTLVSLRGLGILGDDPGMLGFLVLFPVAMWSVFRLDARITHASVVLIATLAILSCLGCKLSTSGEDLNLGLIHIQLFVSILAITIDILKSVLEEREAIAERLRATNRNLESMVQERTRELEAQNDALRASQARLATLVDATSAVTWSCPASGLHVKPQPSWMAFTGQSAEEMLGAGWASAIHPDDRPGSELAWKQAITRQEPFTHEHRIRRSDGQWRWTSVHAAPLRDDNDQIVEWIGMNLDITERKQAEERARELAYYDPLTALPNRRLLEERLTAALAHLVRHGGSLGVMVLDLDHFKAINDGLGHAVGDLLLVEVARRMRDCLRAVDTVARPGGDEFIVLAPEVEAESAAPLAKKLVARLSEPMQLGERELSVSCSLGIALAPRDGCAAGELIACADTAMYRAKQEGRNRYQFFTAEIQREALRQMTLEHELRRALRADELRLYFMPRVDLDTEQLVGLQALVHWQHPRRGLLDPDEFMACAESCGLMQEIGGWSLHAICVCIADWMRSGVPVMPVAIGVSARQFGHPERSSALVAEIKALLTDNAIDGSLLEIGLTENSLLDESEGTLDRLQALHRLGVRLTLEAFGTGYSSMGRLGVLRVDHLKIDRSFVRGAPDQPRKAAIVQSILALGRHLDFEVIADGIDNRAQLDLLRGSGCRVGQGAYFSDALPPEAAESWLRGAVASREVG